MLTVPGGVAPPSVVGDDDHDPGAVTHKLGKEITKHRFIADDRGNGNGFNRVVNLSEVIGTQAANGSAKIKSKFLQPFESPE